MRNIISNGKSADGARLPHHNIATTAAPTPSRKQPRDTEGGYHAPTFRQVSKAGSFQDAAAQNPDPPRCNRSRQHAPGPSCDHHPCAADIVNAKAHREQFPARGHAEQHFQWQNQQTERGCRITTLIPPQHRHHLASSPATQKENPRTNCVTGQQSRFISGRHGANPQSPTVQSIAPACARPVV